MSNELNATFLFENKDLTCKNSCEGCKSLLWPRSSESFWTSAFAFFLLYLSEKNGDNDTKINIWWRIPGKGKKPPYYEHKNCFSFNRLTFDCISVEPQAKDVITWSKENGEVAGISPDLLLIVNNKNYLIENKVLGHAYLGKNQWKVYPTLAESLEKKGKDTKYYVLQSIGCYHPKLFKQTLELQEKLNNDGFGIILWEDILRQMVAEDFKIGNLNPKFNKWEKYTKALNEDVKEYKEVKDYDYYDPSKTGENSHVI